MAPPYKNKTGAKNERWWDNAYLGNDAIVVEYRFVHDKDVIEPGTKIRFKFDRQGYKFRCVAHNILLDSRWIDCIGDDGAWYSMSIEKLKGVVKPRVRRRRASAKVSTKA